MVIKMKIGLLVLLLGIFALSGCAPSSLPSQELSVFKGSCHVIGNDVYFAYNGADYVAKGQASGYNSQSKKNSLDISVIELQDGTFIIPNQ